MPSLLRTLRHWILSVIATHVITIHALTFRHLLKADETFGIRLTSYHNLYFLLNLMKQVRQAIMDDNLLNSVSILWKNMAIISQDVISKMELI